MLKNPDPNKMEIYNISHFLWTNDIFSHFQECFAQDKSTLWSSKIYYVVCLPLRAKEDRDDSGVER